MYVYQFSEHWALKVHVENENQAYNWTNFNLYILIACDCLLQLRIMFFPQKGWVGYRVVFICFGESKGLLKKKIIVGIEAATKLNN